VSVSLARRRLAANVTAEHEAACEDSARGGSVSGYLGRVTVLSCRRHGCRDRSWGEWATLDKERVMRILRDA
jgi:hypothetical protein